MLEDYKYGLLKSFHEQFAQNQNHHQKLFIQFISAVFIVIAGYVIVYTNTNLNADIFKIQKDPENRIISYAVIHLLGSYYLSQSIFILLISIILNMGYNFRRDQKVNYNIRIEILEDELYKKIYGEKAFNPSKLNFKDYLPGFNILFYSFIIILQLLFFLSLFLNKSLLSKLEISSCLEFIILIFPIFFSLYLYIHFYLKYIKKVKY